MRLDKYLCEAGYGTRSEVKKIAAKLHSYRKRGKGYEVGDKDKGRRCGVRSRKRGVLFQGGVLDAA